MDRGVQTPSSLSTNSPQMLQLKRKLKSANAALKRLHQQQNASEQQPATGSSDVAARDLCSYIELQVIRSIGFAKSLPYFAYRH